MSSIVSNAPGVTAARGSEERFNGRAERLAVRLEQGARALAAVARGLTEAQWRMPLPRDGRPIGVVIHHVASMYPLEIQVAHTVAGGQPVVGVTLDNVHEINAAHAKEFAAAGRADTIALLDRNSRMAAAAIRELTDEQLDRAATVSLNGDAPLTCQFVLEDHAVRHSYHHLDRIRKALAP
jgi:hypothetical protein